MASSTGGAEPTSRRRGGGAKIAVDGGGGILLLGGAVIVAAAAGAALALFRSRTNRKRGPQPSPSPPQPAADQAVQFNEKGLVGVADGDTGRGLLSLISLIQKGEVLAHNSVETDRNPAVEIVTTTAESIESKLILEESEAAHVEEFEVVEEEEDGGREENPPPISPRGEEPESSESDDGKEIIGDAGMCLQSLIQEEILAHNSAVDGSICEIDQPPTFEIVTAADESVQSNPILEESEVTHIKKSVVVGKEEDSDKEETPLTSYQDEETESEEEDDDDETEEEEEEEDTCEESSDGAGSSIESSAEAVWPAEAIEQGEKASVTELIETRNCLEIDGKTKEAVDAVQDEKAAEFEHDKQADIAAKMAVITGLATMEGNKGVEVIITKTHSKGFLLLLALILAGLLLFCSRVLSSSTIAA